MTDTRAQNDTHNGKNTNGHEVSNMSLSNEKAFQNKDNTVSFITKKGTQMGTALYYVTEHIEATDPIRQELRKAVLVLSISLSKISLFDRTNTPVNDIHVNLDVLSNLLSIASGAGLISTANANVLFEVISKIKSSVATLYVKSFGAYANESEISSAHLESVFEQEIAKLPKSSLPTKNEEVTPIQNVTPQPVSEPKIKTTDTVQKDLAMRHIRRESIIRLLKQSKIVSLNDIKDVIPNLSDKTLQRELMSLIEEGVIVRKGEKRWARYSLN